MIISDRCDEAFQKRTLRPLPFFLGLFLIGSAPAAAAVRIAAPATLPSVARIPSFIRPGLSNPLLHSSPAPVNNPLLRTWSPLPGVARVRPVEAASLDLAALEPIRIKPGPIDFFVLPEKPVQAGETLAPVEALGPVAAAGARAVRVAGAALGSTGGTGSSSARLGSAFDGSDEAAAAVDAALFSAPRYSIRRNGLVLANSEPTRPVSLPEDDLLNEIGVPRE